MFSFQKFYYNFSGWLKSQIHILIIRFQIELFCMNSNFKMSVWAIFSPLSSEKPNNLSKHRRKLNPLNQNFVNLEAKFLCWRDKYLEYLYFSTKILTGGDLWGEPT